MGGLNLDRDNNPRDADQIYGRLPDWAIVALLNRGDIKVTPMPKEIDPLSIDLALGDRLYVLKPSRHPIDVRVGVTPDDYKEILLTHEPYIFKPGDFVIAETLENITLGANIMGRMEGKSSLARLGVSPYVGAARFDPGWSGPPVLELTNSGPRPFTLYSGMKICAFSFERLMAPTDRQYQGRYVDGAVVSKVHINNGLD